MRYRPSLSDTSEVSLKLDKYEDIFSDFDIRPFSGRALSVDFLDEIKRATRDKGDNGIELILNVAETKRSEFHETTIKERLASHFGRHYRLLLEEKRHITRLGVSMVTMGIACMIAATFVVFSDPSRNLLLSFLVVFLEPAAWFLLWEGMDLIIFHSKKINPELEFYRRMTESSGNIHFKSY